MSSPVALTGTPGVGKSSVAQALQPALRSIEVGDLALRCGAGRRIGEGIEVDVPRLSRCLRRARDRSEFDLWVGHLAHLLPCRDIIVLRCHPAELGRRLAAADRGTPRTRRENATAEALDLVLIEAVRPGHRVWEIDTTARTVEAVAHEVRARFRRRGPPEYGRLAWLNDPSVTEGLLGRGR